MAEQLFARYPEDVAAGALDPDDIGVTIQAWDADLDAIAGLVGVRGDIIFRNATTWARLPAGTDGRVLTTHGSSADPTWETGGGDIGGPASSTDNALARWDGATGDLLQNSGAILDDSNNLSGIGALSVTTIELGHASDTTLARSSAGVVTIEGVVVLTEGNAEAFVEGAIDTLPNLTSVQSLTVTLADAAMDRLFGWDDSASAYKNFALTDYTDEAAPAAGDYILIVGAEGDVRRTNWSNLPAGGGGISNVVEDTTPQLGGDLDANTFDILFDDATGIYDENNNEQLIFQTTASAANYLEITNSAAGTGPLLQAAGSDTNVALRLASKGTSGIAFQIGSTSEMLLTSTSNSPTTDDGLSLGVDSNRWADLYLADGGVINLGSGNDVTLSHSANLLTLAGGTLVLPNSGLQIGASNPFSDSSGTLTLQNVDALDATTEATIEAAIDTLANLVSVQGFTLTLADAGFDVLFGWDDSAAAFKNFALADIATEATPAAGDFVVIYGAEGDLRKANWNTLPGAGGGLANVVEDTSPQLGGDLDANTFDILFDDGTGILDENANEQLIFQTTASAVNYWEITNAATAGAPLLQAVGSDTDVAARISSQGAGSVHLAIGGTNEVTLTATALSPTANDGSALGTTALGWADVHLATGGVINWANGEVTLTETDANTLTIAGATLLSLGTAAAVAMGTLEVGHATDTTIARVSAGVISVEGVTILSEGNAEAFLETAIDTLANLTSIQGFTVTLADAGADAVLGWDDSAAAYENLTAAEVVAIISTADGAGSGLDADLLDGKNTGTSGNVVPLLDGANTWSALQTFSLGSGAANEPVRVVNTADNASVQVIQLEGDRATMADNDEAYASLLLSDDGGTQTEFARLTWVGTDVNDGTGEDGQFEIDVIIGGSLSQVAAFSGTGLNLAASDALSFGGVAIISDASGTTTLSNIDALDATTEATIEAAIDTLANLTSIQGFTVTFADAGFDVLSGWDDSASAHKNFLLADIATEAAPAAGDFLLVYGAEGDLRKVNWSALPGAGGGISNVVEDTTPQLGGDLDANGFDILFDDGDGLHSSTDEPVLTISSSASAGTGAVTIHALEASFPNSWQNNLKLLASDYPSIFFHSVDDNKGVIYAYEGVNHTFWLEEEVAGVANTNILKWDFTNKQYFADTTGWDLGRAGDTWDVVYATSIELGHDTDTTLTRSSAGRLAVEGAVVKLAGKESVWVPASAMIASSTSGAEGQQLETTTNDVNYFVYDFSSTADEYVGFNIAPPKSWNEGTISYKVYWSSTATGTTGVAWALQGFALSDNEAIDASWGTEVVVTDDAQSAAGELYITAESGAVTIGGSPAAEDLVFFRLFRDVSDANDDMTEDARLIGVKLYFTTDAANDA